MRARASFAAGGFEAACPLIVLSSVVVDEGTGRRGAGVQVYGVDERFWQFHGLGAQVTTPTEDEALLSPSLAQELGGTAGASVRLRIEKPTAIPVESLHGRKDDVGRTLRLQVRGVLAASELGEFALRPQQGEVRAVFVALKRLQRETGQTGKVNTLLLARKSDDSKTADDNARPVEQAAQLLRAAFTLEDLGFRVRSLEAQQALSLESESALVGDELTEAARRVAHDMNLRPVGVFSYLANTIRTSTRETPYSLVSAIEQTSFDELMQGAQGVGNEQSYSNEPRAQSAATPILLNEWAAADLGAHIGDTVSLDYYLWREEGRLTTETAAFRLAGIVPMQGLAADRQLTPDYPGISNTESLSDWDPPFPVNLERVRPQDEDYWRRYRTTPKAFIPLTRGQELWQTRFGRLTSVRFYPPANVSLDEARAGFENNLRAALDPVRAGFAIVPVRADGLQAARGATDFGEYFLYFSFFIVLSALMLVSLFFKLGIEQRVREIGLLQAVGFPAANIRTLFLSEGFMLAALGSLLGLGGALLYGALMMWGLRTWWVDAVGTRLLSLHVAPLSLAAGGVGGIVAALLCVWWTLRALRRVSTRSLLAGSFDEDEPRKIKPRRNAKHNQTDEQLDQAASRPRATTAFIVAIACGLSGLLLLALAAAHMVGETVSFFGAGVLLLVALLAYQSVWLRRGRSKLIQGRGWWPVVRLGWRNAAHRPGRSVLCIALVAAATFIIVAVDAFRQDSRVAATDKRSGNGGYALMAETLLPLTHDPNAPAGREALSLDGEQEAGTLAGVTFARFRVRPGDDASCLNLYQPRNPKLLAATPDFIRQNRFAFQSSLAATPDEQANPWLLLEREPDAGAIPIAADAKSMTYVLHRKLGDEIVLQGDGGAPVRLRLVAALADSLFQSELLLSERNFLRAFPAQQGYRFFLLDVPPARAPEVAGLLEDRLSDYGFDATGTAERLAAYHRVENTYLSTFQTLGGLGMLLGTVGLATVLLRNVLERRRELALLRAVGYGARHFVVLVVAENALLLVCGLATGTVCAMLAIAPALFARTGGGLPNLSLLVLLLAVLATGFLASLLATIATLRSPLLPALRAD